MVEKCYLLVYIWNKSECRLLEKQWTNNNIEGIWYNDSRWWQKRERCWFPLSTYSHNTTYTIPIYRVPHTHTYMPFKHIHMCIKLSLFSCRTICSFVGMTRFVNSNFIDNVVVISAVQMRFFNSIQFTL